LALTKVQAEMDAGGPAFRAVSATQQNLTTSTWTKIAFGTETFDTANAFDSTTNYRFQPTVAGYYQVQGNIIYNSGTLSITFTSISLYKNGTNYGNGTYDSGLTGNSAFSASVSELVYLNGSTDYIEMFGYVTGTSPYVASGNAVFSASLIKAA
jgi:hypothetical protein